MAEALRLYRASLRMANEFPVVYIRKKLRWVSEKDNDLLFQMFLCVPYCRYNIRDLFEIFRGEQDVVRRQQLIARGWKNVEAMRQLSKLEEKDLQELFIP